MNSLTTEPKIGLSPRVDKIGYDEFLRRFPDQYAEYVDGEILTEKTVTRSHSELRQFLSAILEFYVSERRLARIYGEPFQMKLSIGSIVKGRESDIFVVLNENLERVNELYLDGPADVAVEIVSKESRRLDRVEKWEEYRLSGIKEYWLIDPENRSAELFELDANGQYFPIPVNQSGTFRSSVLAGFWLDPNWLWSDPRPTVREVASALGLL